MNLIKKIIKNIKSISKSVDDLQKINDKIDNIFLSINALTKDLLFKDILFSTYLKTFFELLNTEKSFIRFGDGEFLFMLSEYGTCFEKFEIEKSKELLQTWKECNNDENIMVGVDDFLIYPDFSNLDKINYYNSINFISALPNIKILSLLSKNVRYYSQQIFALPPIMWSNTNVKNNNKNIKFFSSADDYFLGEKKYSEKKFYLNTSEGKKILNEYNKNYFCPLQKIFTSKVVILITSKKSKFCLNNELFEKAKEIINIWCDDNIDSNSNYQIIDKIKKMQTNKKNTICVVSYGVSGKIISLHVHKLGIRVLDMGSFSVVYDYYNGLNNLENYDERNNSKKFKLR